MIDFQTVWSYSNNVYGSFSEAEAKKLFDLLTSLKPGSIVVEVGSYCGRSASVIGQVAGREEHNLEFYCIDNFVTGWEDKDVPAIFAQNMKGIKHELIRLNSKRASHLFDENEIDLLFIDGDHTYDGVLKDIEHYEPKVNRNGIVLFHDYNSSWDGVKRAVDEKYTVSEVVDSMAVIRP